MNFDYLWENGPQMTQSDHFKLGTDSVLLGNFVKTQGTQKGIDLGTCTGVLPILLLSRNEKLYMDAIEIDDEATKIAEQNMSINNISNRCCIVNDDLKNCSSLFSSGAYDFVISNPPYFPLSAGMVSPDIRKAKARGEVSCTIEDICSAAKYLCRWDGKLYLVYKPDRLPELFETMRRNSIEPKRMRFVCHDINSVPSLCLVEGRRGGNPGLSVEKILFIKDENGEDSQEIKEIYHRT